MVLPCVPGDHDRVLARGSRARRARRGTSGTGSPPRAPRAPRGCPGAPRCRSRRGRAPREHVLGAKPSARGCPSALEQRAHRRVDAGRRSRSRRRPRACSSPASEPIPVPRDRDEVDVRGRSLIGALGSSAAKRLARSRGRGRSGAARSGCVFATRCTRLVSITTIASRSRSIQSDVPVKPRWPIERAEKYWPDDEPPRRRRVPAERPVRALGQLLALAEARARAARGSGVAAAVPGVEHGLARSASRRRRWRTGRRGRRRRPSPHAFGSCTSPQTIRPRHGQFSVAAMRRRCASASSARPRRPATKRVSRMPSGSNTRSRAEVVERLARHRLDHRAEHDEVEVAVDRGLARLVHERRAADALEDPTRAPPASRASARPSCARARAAARGSRARA